MTTGTNDVLTKFLVPLNLDGQHEQTVRLMKCLAVTLGQRVEQITLCHVTGGSYLSRHMSNIDIRAGKMLSTEKFRELRQVHIDKSVLPVLEKVKEELRAAGITAEISLVVKDGDPVEQIVKMIREENFTSLILQRSEQSAMQSLLVGKVSSGILHHEIDATIYLPPAAGTPTRACPPKTFLVALDGSKNSLTALQQAAVLASSCKESLEKIVLASVLDVAECSETLAGGMEPKSFDSALLDQAVTQLTGAGIIEDKILQSLTCGEPASVLPELVKDNNVDFVFMGRRDRGVIRELFMGSVSTTILQQCMGQTIVLVNAD